MLPNDSIHTIQSQIAKVDTTAVDTAAIAAAQRAARDSVRLSTMATVQRDSAGRAVLDTLGRIQRNVITIPKTEAKQQVWLNEQSSIENDQVIGPVLADLPTDSLTIEDVLGQTCLVIEPTDETLLETEPDSPIHDWTQGRQGEERTVNIGDNSGVLAIISCIFILMMLGYKQCRRLFSTLGQQLWGMRRRANVFDNHTTNETRYMVLMAVQWCVFTGLLLYSAISVCSASHWLGVRANLPASHAFEQTAVLIGVMAVYYIFQYVAYQTLGYTFADGSERKLLVKGFVASQAILGFALILPALVAIFYPYAAKVCVIVGVSLYIIAKIIFIIKCFRIFYTKFGSLFYFILYLCTLEIIPLICVCQIALILVNSL